MDAYKFRDHVSAIPRLAGFLQAGRVQRWPRKATLSEKLLDVVVVCLGNPRKWTEKEITNALSEISSDPVSLRRALVDTKRLVRSPDGRIYELLPKVACSETI